MYNVKIKFDMNANQNAGVYVQTCYDVTSTSLLKVGLSLENIN